MPGIMSDDGDFLLTSLRPGGHSTPRALASPGRQSLLTAMNNFVNAVDEMDGAVMIPCKLQDMQLEEDGSDSVSINSEGDVSPVCPPTPPRDAMNGHSNGLVTIPEEKILAAPGQIAGGNKGIDLYNYYGMLRAIKAELVRGPSESPEDEEELVGSDGSDGEQEDDVAKQTAHMFRHHLRGLFGVLRQMTSTADKLTERYQSEIGDSSLSSNRSLAHYTI